MMLERQIRLRITCLPLIFCLHLTTVFAGDLLPAEKERQRIEVLQRIAPTVVCVMPPGGQGGGSGVLISEDGYAISNYHVTSGSGDFMKCGLNDGRLYDAVIVGIDPTGDVALIKLLGRDDFPFCQVGNSDLVRTGDEVLALGNPFLLASDFTPTVTYGIVSGTQRYQYPANSFLEYTDCIQIDASINPGNSGGPLFNIRGEWIGINGRASFEKRGRINTGAAYAISVRQVMLFVEQLKSGRIVDHGRTEFTVKTAPGGIVEIQETSQLSEAGRRGLKPGDELISFAGRSLTSANDFKNIVGTYPAGTRLPFTYRNRDGVHQGSVRLKPLHEFDSAPPIPGGRPPQRPRRGEKPDDDEEDGNNPLRPLMPRRKPPEEPSPPAEYAHLFEARAGFANYYFNRTQLEEVLAPLKQVLPDNSESDRVTWVMRLQHLDQPTDDYAELLVGGDAAGLLGDNWPVAHQTAAELSAENEPFEYYGLLAGAMHWYRFFSNEQEQFSEVIYHGVEKLSEESGAVRVVVVKDGVQTARWYFKPGEALPIGVDLEFSAGADEARIRFRNWADNSELPRPAQIGLIDSDTQQTNWLRILSLKVKKVTSESAGEGS